MTEIDRTIRTYQRVGLIALLLGIGGAGSLATTAQLSGAIIAAGTVVVETSVKKIQHPNGGIVGDILVKDGDKVMAGDLLVRLDHTMTRANLQIINQQIDELEMRDARIEHELALWPLATKTEEFVFPARFAERSKDPYVMSLYATEKIAYDARRSTCSSQSSQYDERVAQLKEEAAGLQDQITATAKEIKFIHAEIEGLEQLETKQLVTTTRMVERRREEARLVGRQSQLRADAAQIKGKIAEIELQKLNHFEQLRGEVNSERREIQTKLSELKERQIAAQDLLSRTDIRSPQSGIVHELSVHTIGGVIAPGEQIMLIVPDNDDLSVDVEIRPSDISQVMVGQKSVLRFTGFHRGAIPEIVGTVARIGADLSLSETTRSHHFLARISVRPDEMEKLNGTKISPGMPVEVYMETESRTVMSYLFQPFVDQFRRALRES